MKRLLETLLKILNNRKRRILIVVATVLALTACTAGTSIDQASAQPAQLNSEHKMLTVNIVGLHSVVSLTLLQQEQRKALQLNKNAIRMKATVKALKKTAGHTWYVFSGATPSGWDCSGLVVWFYGHMGVTLEHRASLQATSGKIVKTPMIGDIVAFYYHGYSTAHHVGIYIGNGKFISAPRPGQVTTIERLSHNQFILDGSYMRYVRIVDQKALPTS
jgi:cell wall-associated NlpC family hydrolase